MNPIEQAYEAGVKSALFEKLSAEARPIVRRAIGGLGGAWGGADLGAILESAIRGDQTATPLGLGLGALAGGTLGALVPRVGTTLGGAEIGGLGGGVLGSVLSGGRPDTEGLGRGAGMVGGGTLGYLLDRELAKSQDKSAEKTKQTKRP